MIEIYQISSFQSITSFNVLIVCCKSNAANIQIFYHHKTFKHFFAGRFIKSQYKSVFQQVSKTRKAVHTTMITTYGVTHNAYWNNIQSEVKMDDLFKENR